MKNFKVVASRLARLSVVAALLIAFAAPTFAQESSQGKKAKKAKKMKTAKKKMKREAAAQKGFVGTLKARGNFTTLIGALKKTGLAKQLKQGDQKYTLFAPTDEAFAQLPEGALKSMSKDQLANVLRNHLVAGSMASTAALKKGQLSSVQGAKLTVAEGASGATVNGASIVKADVKTRDGVIHVIDSVLMPKKSMQSMSGDAGMPEEDAGGSR